jgi:hypothetical protein
VIVCLSVLLYWWSFALRFPHGLDNRYRDKSPDRPLVNEYPHKYHAASMSNDHIGSSMCHHTLENNNRLSSVRLCYLSAHPSRPPPIGSPNVHTTCCASWLHVDNDTQQSAYSRTHSCKSLITREFKQSCCDDYRGYTLCFFPHFYLVTGDVLWHNTLMIHLTPTVSSPSPYYRYHHNHHHHPLSYLYHSTLHTLQSDYLLSSPQTQLITSLSPSPSPSPSC